MIIEFRGKTSSGRWLYGDFRHGWSDESPSGYITEDHRYVMVRAETVGQFTGLNDRDGKRIYEGDVVEMDTSYHNVFIGIVKYINKRALFALWESRDEMGWIALGSGYSYKVIGNIFDNTELKEKYQEVWSWDAK